MLYFLGANVLRVLPLAHEYQSPLVTDCENFMIRMCTPQSGVTVSRLLDYILAVEFCAKIDFDFLTGKQFQINYRAFQSFILTENTSIYSKFSNIDIKTWYAIALKRVQHLEMNRRKLENSHPVENDYKLML